MTSMDLSTAMGLLGLSWDFTPSDVLKAYKRCMLESHPDKNPDPASTARAQRINEARDFLLSRAYFSEQERREAKMSAESELDAQNIQKVKDWMEEMDFASQEAKDQFQSWFRVTTDAYLRIPLQPGFDQWFVVVREYHEKCKSLQRRERYNANLKKKRKDGSRAHRKTSGYKEGKAVMSEISKFLQDNVVISPGSRLFVSDIHKRFLETRKDVSALELRLFNRHYKKMLLGNFPGSFYCRYKLQRSFADVALK